MGTIRVRLREILKERNMTQKELAAKAGIREATVSMFARDAVTTLNKEVTAKILDALDIDDIRELIEYVPDEK